jgi:hypothetical protein
MALPFASWQAHEYEGELAANPIVAVEAGRRVTFAQVTVTQRQDSPWNVHPAVLLVEQANPAAPTDQPTWSGRKSLHDHPLLERIHNESPPYRRPELVGQTVYSKPTLIPWEDGYLVGTQPFIVAFPVEREAFAHAKAVHAIKTSQPYARGSFKRAPATWKRDQGRTPQQYNFPIPWVEPGVLPIRVNVIQILAEDGTLRTIRLREPMTVDALLDVLATPAGIEPHIAEEIGQP